MNTMDFQKTMGQNFFAMNEDFSANVLSMQPQSVERIIDGNNSKNADATNTDKMRTSDGSSSIEDKNSMFTKFAFPFKLHSILENADKVGQDHIISWLPSGKAFKIHKPKEFADAIMPQYFNQTKYRSFQRQLYIYGFDRIKDKLSNDFGAYFHELFIRGASDLCLDMQRQKIKGTGLSNEERRRRSKSKPFANKCPPMSTTRTAMSQNSVVGASSTATNQSSIPSAEVDIQFLGIQSTHTTPYNLTSLLPQVEEQTSRKVSCMEWENGNAAASIKSALQIQEMASLESIVNNNDATAVIKSALRVQEIASRSNTVKNSDFCNTNIYFGGIRPQCDMLVKRRRRCSLDFVPGTRMGRRGSLLFDGDEVCFGDRKFYFTTEY